MFTLIKSFENPNFGLTLVESKRGYQIISVTTEKTDTTWPIKDLKMVMGIYDQLLNNYLSKVGGH